MSDGLLQRIGRGGAGNVQKPSSGLPTTSTAGDISKQDHNPTANKVEYVHHGRGGAGNLSTTSNLVQPVQSVLNQKTDLKPAKGRGGAGNIESASAELNAGSAGATSAANAAAGTAPPKVVDVPSEESEKAGREVTEPEAAHLV